MARLMALALLVLGASAWAAVSLSITPSGLQPQFRDVRLVVTARIEPGSQVESFELWYNLAPITSEFARYAALTRPDDRTLAASIDKLFAPGVHTVTASLKMSGEPTATATTTFEVPDEDQNRMRNTVLARIGDFLHRYDARQFAAAISLGDAGVFAARAADPSFQVYVDPDYLEFGTLTGSVAQYVELYWFGLSYYRDLVLGVDPGLFRLGTSNEPLILWHEMIHAVSHAATLNGSPLRLPAAWDGATDEQTDHYYLYWAEYCLSGGVPRLDTFEAHAVQNRGSPTAQAAAIGRTYWRQFIDTCNQSSEARGVPTPQERERFRALIGFDIDPVKIKAHLLAQGFSPLYFDATAVVMLQPAHEAEVTGETIEARARLTVEAGTTIGQVGFVLDGVVHAGVLQGDLISATLPLSLCAHQLQAGAVVLDPGGLPGQAVVSTAITVTRKPAPVACPQIKTWTDTDQALFAPLRITRVDHGNTAGAVYFYRFFRPNDRQERSILGTYFSVTAAPPLTRDFVFANNLGLSLISFGSAADAATIWSREMTAFDTQAATGSLTTQVRDPTTAVWSWTGLSGTTYIQGMALLHGSVIGYLNLSSAGGESAAQEGLAALKLRAATTIGLVDVKCGGR